MMPNNRHMRNVQDLTAQQWLAQDEERLAATLARATDVVAASGQGAWLTDVEGQRWLDLTSGIGVTNTGHCHPKVVEAIQEQAAQLIHTSIVAHQPRAIELAQRLTKHAPWFADPQVFFCNTGAEAVDGSIKFARKVTGRPGIIAFGRAFHGRTIGGTSLTTAKAKYRDGYEPLMPSVYGAAYPYPSRMGGAENATRIALASLDAIFETQMPASRCAAIIVEPVLGEGGYVVPPVAWLQGLRERATLHGILLIFDEVQCGVGRTGRMFAAETFGVAPDILLFAKGIASGMPLGGLMAERETFEHWPPGAHGSTFGGNPLSCAAALATLDIIEGENILEHTREAGSVALAKLQTSIGSHDDVIDVRGRGLMIGVEFKDAETAERVADNMHANHVLVLRCGTEENILRLIPPLVISLDELHQALDVLIAGVVGG
jgi:4-aminobutyrate aminotransferase